jgi:hypothetical protein
LAPASTGSEKFIEITSVAFTGFTKLRLDRSKSSQQYHFVSGALAISKGAVAAMSAWTPRRRYLKKREFEGEAVSTINVLFDKEESISDPALSHTLKSFSIS